MWGPAVLFLVLWAIAFPFIYGQGLSRLFGLQKTIDHWILFFLHSAVSSMALIIAFILDLCFYNAFISVPALTVFMVVSEGVIWQCFLKDRKINGFIASLICNAIFIIPYVIAFVIFFATH